MEGTRRQGFTPSPLGDEASDQARCDAGGIDDLTLAETMSPTFGLPGIPVLEDRHRLPLGAVARVHDLSTDHLSRDDTAYHEEPRCD